MRLHRIAVMSALLVLACSATLAHAWGGEGHQVVALIAENHLTPQAKAGIAEVFGKSEDGVDAEISDAQIVNWADQVKRTRRATADWHYVNIPIATPRFDPRRDGKKRENVVEKIEDQAAILANPKADPTVRAEALKWVVHLVGDLHQPLHCADRNDDKGGNAVLVRWMDSKAKQPANLHGVWDGLMLRVWLKGTGVADYAAAIEKATPAKDAKAWTAGTPVEWANEAVLVARDHADRGVPDVDAGRELPHIDQAYLDRSRPVVDRQLVRGGLRLAVALNQAFASAAAGKPKR